MVKDPSRNNGTKTGPGNPPVEHRFKPGNPGRPKGARNKLGEEFLQDLLADWTDHGIEVLEAARKSKPEQYLKVVASVLPRELNVRVSELDELSDEQLAAQFARVSSQLARAGIGVGEGNAPPVQSQSVN